VPSGGIEGVRCSRLTMMIGPGTVHWAARRLASRADGHKAASPQCATALSRSMRTHSILFGTCRARGPIAQSSGRHAITPRTELLPKPVRAVVSARPCRRLGRPLGPQWSRRRMPPGVRHRLAGGLGRVSHDGHGMGCDNEPAHPRQERTLRSCLRCSADNRPRVQQLAPVVSQAQRPTPTRNERSRTSEDVGQRQYLPALGA
jgi:hypothetical protein